MLWKLLRSLVLHKREREESVLALRMDLIKVTCCIQDLQEQVDWLTAANNHRDTIVTSCPGYRNELCFGGYRQVDQKDYRLIDTDTGKIKTRTLYYLRKEHASKD